MKENEFVLGLMSGTSLDGLDMALCRFAKAPQERWTYEVEAVQTCPYDAALRKRLATATELPACELVRLDAALATEMAGMVNRFRKSCPVRPQLIASHGHTVFHQPSAGVTLQIGSGAILAALTGITTVCDFRTADVALGGQGAPLAPLGDELLFGSYEACLNLGGIANISFREKGLRRAFDVSPCNMALNGLAGQLGMDFDRNGETARGGKVDSKLLDRLNGLAYYRLRGPKSLGKEWFEAVFRPCLEASASSVEDKLRTVVEHVALQVAAAADGREEERVLVTGGGAWNGFLVERMQSHVRRKLAVPDAPTVNGKEAIIFALLGFLRMRNGVNCLSSATGASADHCAGAVYPGKTGGNSRCNMQNARCKDARIQDAMRLY
ncbi:MAG: anhydro-N-acetylmuramic acid kinase [Tannerella sp.]|jgi:anhydro-N-acetylmuramic acid kinase|nr:anhydro-N-acetylmuramic acid kinase [Tannerella sp.]